MITEADNSPDDSDSLIDTMSIIGPVSPLKPNVYYDTIITGCRRRCPCRLWTNCSYYKTSKWKKLRIDENIIWKEIHDYYDNYFKFRSNMPESNMNA